MQTVIKDDLVKFNIENYFEFYAGIRGKNPDFKKGLPHFIEIAKKFKIPFKEFAKQSVYIGDTKTDIDISKEAGMISIIRAKKDKIDHFKHLGADFVVVDFTTLPLLIEKISLSL